MKAVILLALLAVFAVESAVVPASEGRSNFSVGVVRPGDKLLKRAYLNVNPVYNAIRSQDLVYKGKKKTVISAVTVSEVGATQFASAWVFQGGVGYNHVTVRAETARGRGYHYMIEIWGR